FYGLSAKNLINAVGWAVYTWYNQKDRFAAMRKRAMKLDYGWEKSAKTYEALYFEALKRANKAPV
ncbi:MAG: hypothetical protein LBO72_10885, partial [Helicobacteraceae bacterium]|nr:hypothetical protein [Helicobacteraceae bacterium]